jgi:hypothetical protein
MLCLTLYQRNVNTEISSPLPSVLPFTIGRGKASDEHIELLSEIVSRVHARVSPHDGRWIVEDLGSRNGIYDSEGKRQQSIVLTNADDNCFIAAPPNGLGTIEIRVIEGEFCQCERPTTRVDLKAWRDKAAAAIDDLAELVLSNSEDTE